MGESIIIQRQGGMGGWPGEGGWGLEVGEASAKKSSIALDGIRPKGVLMAKFSNQRIVSRFNIQSQVGSGEYEIARFTQTDCYILW